MSSLYAHPPTDDVRWLVEILAAAAPASAPWLDPSAFHFLRTRPPSEHPAFGPSLLLWQRAQARFGARCMQVAFTASWMVDHRGPPEARFALRICELWSRHFADAPVVTRGPLRIPEPSLSDLDWILEDLALGATHPHGATVEELNEVLATHHLAGIEARALARLELYFLGRSRDLELLRSLVPSFMEDQSGPVPKVTLRLLGSGLSEFLYTPPHHSTVDKVLGEVRQGAVARLMRYPDRQDARTVLSACERLTGPEVLAIAGCAVPLPLHPAVVLPPPEELIDLIADGDARHAVDLASVFPSLAGVAEAAGGLPGLTGWLESCARSLPATVGERVEPSEVQARQWSQWTRKSPQPVEAATPLHELLRALRLGEALPLEQVQRWLLEGRWGVDLLLFDSAKGPGLLDPAGHLNNALGSWPAPETLVLAHPVDLPAAERRAWQQRLLSRGIAPFNQVFREHSLPPRRDAPRRTNTTRISRAALDRLAPAGWFPLLAPAECAPELDLGDLRARLMVDRAEAEWTLRGIDFISKGKPMPAANVPPRLFSEAWRDVREAIALLDPVPRWQPVPARGELVQALEERLGRGPLRLEADHVACRETAADLRLALGNALPSSGEVIPEAEARELARPVLPFVDDGGVAALLVGRLRRLGLPTP